MMLAVDDKAVPSVNMIIQFDYRHEDGERLQEEF